MGLLLFSAVVTIALAILTASVSTSALNAQPIASEGPSHLRGRYSDSSDCSLGTLGPRWLFAEFGGAGLGNQLFGVYSSVPAAKLLKANGIVMGRLQTRQSFNLSFADMMRTAKKLQFSDCYDLGYFRSYWSARGLNVLEAQDIHRCLHKHNFTDLKKPRFWPMKDSEILNFSNTVTPIDVPPKEVQILRIVDCDHLVPMMHHWQSQRHVTEYQQMFQSLRPSANIQNAIEIIAAELPMDFLLAHVRLEPDLIADNDDFVNRLPQHVEHVLSSPCVRKFVHDNPNSPLPALYLSTGLSPEGGSALSSRFWALHDALNKSGFVDIRHKDTIPLSTKHRAILATLYPEQKALVDLTLAGRAFCFIESLPASSFSFFAHRHRHMAKKTLTMQDVRLPDCIVNCSSAHFLGWE